MNYTKISRELLKSLNFKVMTDSDRNGFCGVESPVAFIADNEDEGICVILDGDHAELYAYDGCANFEMIDLCEDIRGLPYETQGEYFDEWDGATEPSPIGIRDVDYLDSDAHLSQVE